MIENGQDDDDANAILKWILRGNRREFSQRHVKQRFKSLTPVDERVTAALKELTRRHYTSEVIIRKTGGRDSFVYKVNPACFEGGV
jgi:hypothetical protein